MDRANENANKRGTTTPIPIRSNRNRFDNESLDETLQSSQLRREVQNLQNEFNTQGIPQRQQQFLEGLAALASDRNIQQSIVNHSAFESLMAQLQQTSQQQQREPNNDDNNNNTTTSNSLPNNNNNDDILDDFELLMSSQTSTISASSSLNNRGLSISAPTSSNTTSRLLHQNILDLEHSTSSFLQGPGSPPKSAIAHLKQFNNNNNNNINNNNNNNNNNNKKGKESNTIQITSIENRRKNDEHNEQRGKEELLSAEEITEDTEYQFRFERSGLYCLFIENLSRYVSTLWNKSVEELDEGNGNDFTNSSGQMENDVVDSGPSLTSLVVVGVSFVLVAVLLRIQRRKFKLSSQEAKDFSKQLLAAALDRLCLPVPKSFIATQL